MPGPPPSRNPRRTNARPDWRQLPAAGRPGDPPPWPLTVLLSDDERELWAQLWATPQAVAWEALGWTRVVARYARVAIQAEDPDASGVILAEVRQLEDRLGLNPMSMRRLLWEIVATPAVETPDDVANLDEYRARLG